MLLEINWHHTQPIVRVITTKTGHALLMYISNKGFLIMA